MKTWPAPQNLIHMVESPNDNGQAVAAKHSLQVTDEQFRQAVQNPLQHTARNPWQRPARKTQQPQDSP